jgi:hypothetical protein
MPDRDTNLGTTHSISWSCRGLQFNRRTPMVRVDSKPLLEQEDIVLKYADMLMVATREECAK